MPRPIKNNAEYFSHDNNMRDDPKIKAVRREFGLEGYAVWCMLLETLTNQTDFRLDVEENTLELLAGDFSVDPNALAKMLSSFRRLKLIADTDEAIYCEALRRRMEPLMQARARKREWAESKKASESTPAPQLDVLKTSETTPDEVLDVQNTQSKVKESKELNREDKSSLVGLSNPTADAPEEKPKKRARRHNAAKSEDVAEVLAYLNEKAHRNFRGSKSDCTTIAARFAEGYMVEDFKAIVDHKVGAWMNDVRLCEYLRPETLFAAKHFDSYLNAAKAPKPAGASKQPHAAPQVQPSFANAQATYTPPTNVINPR